MESQSTPRITAPYLDAYQGRNVIVVGRVVQLRGEAAVIDADGNITAHLNREIPTMQEAHLSNGNAVQIIGKVNADLSIRALSSLDLGAGVDLNVYQHVVDASQKHDQLFGAGSTH